MAKRRPKTKTKGEKAGCNQLMENFGSPNRPNCELFVLSSLSASEKQETSFARSILVLNNNVYDPRSI
jgi:hypothetical protein